ncbi:hypothetical protein OBBRIDRAFT_497783 [Obba rivulosa]|uniref:Uncharacterized protein n=1 Tax=Obba rivulosa TaxID=1052685 RepID=A0A8E2DU29_9APHY|nr:hypothetical protein OBBRIDRAFT_497783 [Obba rivulosa]
MERALSSRIVVRMAIWSALRTDCVLRMSLVHTTQLCYLSISCTFDNITRVILACAQTQCECQHSNITPLMRCQQILCRSFRGILMEIQTFAGMCEQRNQASVSANQRAKAGNQRSGPPGRAPPSPTSGWPFSSRRVLPVPVRARRRTSISCRRKIYACDGTRDIPHGAGRRGFDRKRTQSRPRCGGTTHQTRPIHLPAPSCLIARPFLLISEITTAAFCSLPDVDDRHGNARTSILRDASSPALRRRQLGFLPCRV